MNRASRTAEALLLVDIQNDYFPGGAYEVPGSQVAAGQAAGLLAGFRKTGRPVIHIQHESIRPGSTFFLPGTPGMAIHDSVQPVEGESVLLKHYPNSFRDTGLLETLDQMGIGRLVIAGMMTHMCIDATTRAAFDHGFDCTVVADACAAPALQHGSVQVPAAQVHGAFLAALSGTYAKVVDAASLM